MIDRFLNNAIEDLFKQIGILKTANIILAERRKMGDLFS